MSSEDVSAVDEPQQAGRGGFGEKLRRRPALFGLILVLFCAVMMAYEILAPAMFTSKLDAYATQVPRFSDFAIMIDVEQLEASPDYDALDDSVKRQLQSYPDILADAGIEVGEGNRLRRILIAGKSQSRASLISFYFDSPISFSDGVLTQLLRQEFRHYDIWVRRPPDTPIWYYADRTSGLLMVSDQDRLIHAAIDRREKGAGFRLYKELAEWTESLEGTEPIWVAFNQLRPFRNEEDGNGRTFSGMVAAPPRRVPIAGGTAWITLSNELTVHETLVFKTVNQASDYVEQRTAAAAELPASEASASWTIGDRLLSVQEVEQDGETVTVEQTLPLAALADLLDGWPASESMYRLYLR